MVKVVIVIPVYKRPEIWEICANNLNNFILNETTNKYSVICILSDDDPEFVRNRAVCEKNNYTYCLHPNYPVSDKQNAGIILAAESFDYDYIMHLGSDNFIHPRLMYIYRPFMEKQTAFFGIHRLYFYNYETEQTILFTSVVGNGAIGPGRMIHKSVLDKFKDEGFRVYPSGLNCNMDGGSAKRITEKGFDEMILDVDEFPYIVDIKTTDNITQFEYIAEMSELYVNSEKSVLTNHFVL